MWAETLKSGKPQANWQMADTDRNPEMSENVTWRPVAPVAWEAENDYVISNPLKRSHTYHLLHKMNMSISFTQVGIGTLANAQGFGSLIYYLYTIWLAAE